MILGRARSVRPGADQIYPPEDLVHIWRAPGEPRSPAGHAAEVLATTPEKAKVNAAPGH
jgi:hypothetical protein